MKNSTEINKALAALAKEGGAVRLAAGAYGVDSPVLMNTPSTALLGEVWAYNLDPNGVFETRYGTKLRIRGQEIPAVSVGESALPAGVVIRDIGIQGDIVGMDTRPLWHPDAPADNAGLYFGSRRVDQGEFSKISFCGLGAAVSAAGEAELDACVFEKLNTDGCCMGVYFSPRASYYTRFSHTVMADTPAYGFYADGRGKSIHNLTVEGTSFVRNCGANVTNGENAAVYWRGLSNCTFRQNLVDYPGTFWYYAPDATENDQRQIGKGQAVGLLAEGNKNRILQNVFSHSSAASLWVRGDENLLMGNIADGDVILEGRGNQVNGLCFTGENARLILKGEAKETTLLLGVDPTRVVKE